jgi:L-aspartate oxidase
MSNPSGPDLFSAKIHKMQQEIRTDFLVIGSGIAGLTFALKVAPYGKVLVLTKSTEEETNTKYAQGGIAAVMVESDSYEKHIRDTLVAGDGACNEEVVRMVIIESTERVKELIAWGAEFDRDEKGRFDLAREGGHSEHRILHHKDNTGFEIERALLMQVHSHPNITVSNHYFVLDLITQHHLGAYVNSKTPGIECFGVYVLDTRNGKLFTVLAKATCMSTGGAGNIYESTTNPVIATGDGVAMVYRAKGKVADMEFVQFHPTAFYQPGQQPAFLISEAVRGYGAILRNAAGEAFMTRYDSRGDLAPRDIVARAIDNELKQSGRACVYLDARHLNLQDFTAHFPNIHRHCLQAGIDVSREMIPVVPSAHYTCGGIQVDLHGQSSIRALYAAGECACTGLHGANRLASNSLLEALVYAHRASLHAVQYAAQASFCEGIPAWNAEGTSHPEEMVLLTQSLKELKGIMTNYVGIVRSDLRLQRAFDRLKILHQETETLYEKTTVSPALCELRNMIKVGYIVIKHAMQRKESIGLHYTIDHPRKETA